MEQLAADYLKIPVKEIRQVHIRKRSIDARKKQDILYVYCLDVSANKEKELLKRHGKKGVVAAPQQGYHFPAGGTEVLPHRPVVVGAGPAGLFAALELARKGYRPILLERGQDVETRGRDVEAFWQGGTLNPESNVQFGEGGAGTFSDGKLNTMVKDPTGRIRRVLETFAQYGADPAILYDNKPHIGTDHLRLVIRNLREQIKEYGGEIRFGCKVTDFEIRNDQLTGLWYEQ
ncbi:MAG: FAD-binding protein, partial [Lachnospiraceae bacterium]|nr:FAD-binding protein [Lachnospiraceae bacterium]